MKRVVRANTRELYADGVYGAAICVGTTAHSGPHILTTRLDGYIFVGLNGIDSYWSGPHDSIEDAINNFLKKPINEVYVLDSLSELADWIKDNS
jgi:hypothetical protein